MDGGDSATAPHFPPCSKRGCSSTATQALGFVPSCLRDLYKLGEGPQALCPKHGSMVCSGPRHADEPEQCAIVDECCRAVTKAQITERGWDVELWTRNSGNAPGMWCCNVCRQDDTHGGRKRKREAEKDLGGFGYCQADECEGKDDG